MSKFKTNGGSRSTIKFWLNYGYYVIVFFPPPFSQEESNTAERETILCYWWIYSVNFCCFLCCLRSWSALNKFTTRVGKFFFYISKPFQIYKCNTWIYEFPFFCFYYLKLSVKKKGFALNMLRGHSSTACEVQHTRNLCKQKK